MGRKNWLHLGSAGAGPKIAAVFSVVEISRRLSTGVRAHLRDVLPRVADTFARKAAGLSSWSAHPADRETARSAGQPCRWSYADASLSNIALHVLS